MNGLIALDVLIALAFATSAGAILISRARVTSKMRKLVAKYVYPLRYMIYCWFCTSCWIAAAIVIVYVKASPHVLLLYWLIVVGITAVICGVILYFSPMGQGEQIKLMEQLEAEEGE